MPTYSYACKNCHHQFDIHQSFSDNALTDCPECGGQLRKVFNSVGVVFKGSGFYRNDSRDKSSNTTAASTKDKNSKSSSDSTSSTSSSDASASKTDKPAASPAPAKKSTD